MATAAFSDDDVFVSRSVTERTEYRMLGWV
jgi:hypothetical protein